MNSDGPGRFGKVLLAWELSGRLPGFMSRLVQERVATDVEWSAAYDVLRRSERAAEGTSGLSAAQRRRIEESLFAALPQEKSGRALPVFGLAATAALAVVVVGLGVARGGDEWLARGQSKGALGMKVRCVLQEPPEPRVLAFAVAAEGISGRLVCPTGALLAFSLTNLREHDKYAFIVGLDEQGGLRFVSPFEEASESVRVAHGSVDEVLPILADTAPFIGDSRLTLYALFSDEPLRGGSLQRTIEGAVSRGLAVGALDRLPVSSDVQARIDLVFEDVKP
jgi:hypothetical protein